MREISDNTCDLHLQNGLAIYNAYQPYSKFSLTWLSGRHLYAVLYAAAIGLVRDEILYLKFCPKEDDLGELEELKKILEDRFSQKVKEKRLNPFGRFEPEKPEIEHDIYKRLKDRFFVFKKEQYESYQK